MNECISKKILTRSLFLQEKENRYRLDLLGRANTKQGYYKEKNRFGEDIYFENISDWYDKEFSRCILT